MSVTEEERRLHAVGESDPEPDEGEGEGEQGDAGTGEGGDAGEGGEGGEATGQALEKTEEPKPTPPMQIPLPGDWDRISTAFGGREPDRSEIRLLGGKMPIDGSFDKGAEFDVLVRVKVTGVLGQDTVDAFGTEEGTVRRHFARMISVRRVNKPTPGSGS